MNKPDKKRSYSIPTAGECFYEYELGYNQACDDWEDYLRELRELESKNG